MAASTPASRPSSPATGPGTSPHTPVRLFVTGPSGQVGRLLTSAIRAHNAAGGPVAPIDVTPLGRDAVNLARPETVTPDIFDTPDPSHTFLINLAAFTAVDAAEAPEAQDDVWAVNATAPGLLARAARTRGVRTIQLSTDYVSGGLDPREAPVQFPALPLPWPPESGGYPAGTSAPVNTYGRSKLAGEAEVLASGGLVVRTSWVYSAGAAPGADFVTTMRDLANRGVNPGVVADQWGHPTFAADLANALIELVGSLGVQGAPGAWQPRVLHCAGGGEPVTWCDVAREVFRLCGHDPQRVRPIPTREYPTPAARPLWSALDTSGWAAEGRRALPAWHNGLARALAVG